MNKILLFCFVFVLSLIACNKDVDTETTETITTPPIITTVVNGEVTGKVTDEAGIAVDEATVRLGNEITQTNEYGYFNFRDVPMTKEGTFVKVEKEGYFLGSRTFLPTENTNRVEIALLVKTQLGSFETTTAAQVEVESGTEISFQVNGVVDADGNNYTGTVNVFAKRLDPLAENLGAIMPGNLIGIDKNNNKVALGTYGMLSVELEGTSGEKLQLAEGKTASIRFAVPAELINNAPTTLPLWHFDETNGIWIEEGMATLEGDTYVGEVTHFSYWNWDQPYESLVDISSTVVNEEGVGIPGLRVSIRYVNGCAGGYTLTDNEGLFIATVPTGELFDIVISFTIEECTEVLYEGIIGPFDSEIVLDPIQVDLSLINLFVAEIFGNLQTCYGQITYGFVVIKRESTVLDVIYTAPNGSFNGSLTTCIEPSVVALSAYDLINNKQGESEIDWSENMDAGILNTCEEFEDQYLVIDNDVYGLEQILAAELFYSKIAYNNCSNENQFEVALFTGFPKGLIGESTDPIMPNSSFSGWAIGNSTEAIQITITELTEEFIAGTFTGESNGSFRAARE